MKIVRFVLESCTFRFRDYNSPIADSRFASQKVSVQQKINQLFFEHFKGTYQTENVEEGEIAVITFTYPTLS